MVRGYGSRGIGGIRVSTGSVGGRGGAESVGGNHLRRAQEEGMEEEGEGGEMEGGKWNNERRCKVRREREGMERRRRRGYVFLSCAKGEN